MLELFLIKYNIGCELSVDIICGFCVSALREKVSKIFQDVKKKTVEDETVKCMCS